MNHLTRLFLALPLFSLLAPAARADFQGLDVVVVATDLTLDGRQCGMVRIYGMLSEPDDQLVVAYGDTGKTLELATTDPAGFYQNPLGADLATQISPLASTIDPLVAFDSWVTIGLDAADTGTLLDVGIDWNPFHAGGAILTSNGAWLTLPDEPNVFPVNGRVLLAQLTCGMGTVVHGTLNLQGRHPDAGAPSGFSTWDASLLDFSVPVSTTGSDTSGISLSAGGTQELRLAGGAAHAAQGYLVLATGSGTSPGVPFGGAILPINPDAYTNFGLVHLNLPPYTDTLGLLDAQGTSTATLSLPPGSPAALVGATLHHTWFAWGAGGLTDVTIVGAPVALQFLP